MRTWLKFVMMMVLVVMACACAKKKPATAPAAKPVNAKASPAPTTSKTVSPAVAALIEALKAPTAPVPVPANETPAQKVVRLQKEIAAARAEADAIEKAAAPLREEQKVRDLAARIKMEEDVLLAKKKIMEEDTPLMAEARKRLRNEEKVRENEVKRNRETQAKAQVTGCNSWIDVDPRAVQTSAINVMVQVRIMNQNPFPVDIETPFRGIGTAVKGLCAGGSVTLSFKRHPLLDSESEEIFLLAISRPPASEVLMDERRFRLDVGNVNYRRVESDTWRIQLRR